jgi:rubrerythrin
VEQLNVSDIARLAMLNEEKGARFYRSMTEKADSQKAKDIFHKLALEETEHCKLFASLVRQSDKSERIEQKSAAYLKTLLQFNVFPDDVEDQVNIKSPQEALSIGIQAEKDSILLYQELFNNATSEKTKNILSQLLQEEKMHLIELRHHLEELY